MLDSFRAEFPSFSAALAHVRIPAVSREPSAWAFVSALGAAFLVEAILRSVLLVAPQWVLDPSRQWPFGATIHAMITFASHVVAGVVLIRAGGPRAVLFYVAYAVATALVSLPGIMLFCDRSGGGDGSCRVPLFYIAAGRAPEWIGVAAGIVASRTVPSGGASANRVLRGAGAYVFALFVLTTPYAFVSYAGALQDPPASSALFLIAFGIAAVIGGVVLARAPLAGTVLIALAIVGPSFGAMAPLLRSGGPNGEPLEFTFARWAGVLSSALAALAIVAARGYLRRHRGGTFF